MANRFADAIPPPFVHGYGAKGKSVLQQWGGVHRLRGNGNTVPLWAAAAVNRLGFSSSQGHTANSYAITGLEMEQIKESQGKHTRFDLTQRPLLLSSSGNASHALLLLPQAPQVWARAR